MFIRQLMKQKEYIMNILMLRYSGGFEHSYLPDAEVAIKQIAKANGWQATTTHICSRITAEALANVDVVVFATTGSLPFSDDQKKALLDFVKYGKGFFGIHNANDTGYDWAEYGEMIGGYFNGHPWTQEVGVIVEDTSHPATKMLGNSFKVFDEIYTFKNWSRSKTHVLMRIDNNSVDISKGNREDNDYALGWCHDYGKGRVIYTALGHPDDLWHQDWFRKHIEGCLKWAGRLA
jgi:type 1 glutamine amidotransferase